MDLISQAAAQTQGEPPGGDGAPLAMFVLLVAVLAWIGMRSLIGRLRARKTEAAVHGSFADYALEALVNAAKLDHKIEERERAAILAAMREIAGGDFTAERLNAAFANAKLSKNELVAYLQMNARAFTQDQKVALLQALLAVFIADGNFDEVEHAALIDYTAAVGFDRQKAPDQLRNIAQGFRRGSII